MSRKPTGRASYDAAAKTIDLDVYPDCENPYWIDLHRIDTSDKLVHWIHHLSGKNWFNREMARSLIEVWSKATGNNIHQNV